MRRLPSRMHLIIYVARQLFLDKFIKEEVAHDLSFLGLYNLHNFCINGY